MLSSQFDAYRYTFLSMLNQGAYLNQHIIARDPFKTLDSRSVGSLIALATMKGREINSDLRVHAQTILLQHTSRFISILHRFAYFRLACTAEDTVVIRLPSSSHFVSILTLSSVLRTWCQQRRFLPPTRTSKNLTVSHASFVLMLFVHRRFASCCFLHSC